MLVCFIAVVVAVFVAVFVAVVKDSLNAMKVLLKDYFLCLYVFVG